MLPLGSLPADRSRTVQAAVAENATAADIVMPGAHFSADGTGGRGVLARAGHTEAGCDVARLAGLEPSSVIVEILNEDGTMHVARIWKCSLKNTALSWEQSLI